jgi:STE24 endopeptidase
MPATLTAAFIAALIASTLLRFWLAQRQITAVRTHRDAVPQRFTAAVDLPSHQKAADYTASRMRVAIADLLLEVALVLVFTLGGGLQALSDFWLAHLAAKFGTLAHGVALLLSLFALLSAAGLPLSIYRQFVVEARFGFNRMTPGIFISDLLKQALLGLALGTPLLFAVLWLMSAMGERWWVYVWLFWASFNLLLLFIYPNWIAPLFNKFEPLPEGELRTRIEDLLKRCGFASGGLFVMDGSKRSAHGNAYFTGFGRTKRIVFFDTLIARLTPEEIEAVLAHELGHFKHRHVTKRIALSFVLALAFLWLLAQAMEAPGFYTALGATTPGTAMALALFSLALPPLLFPLSPLTSALSRRHEFEADRYAVAKTRADDLISALVKLYADNAATLTPDRWYSRFHDSHPPAAERIAALDDAPQVGA